MKILLLSILLFISTSFSNNKANENILVGTFEVYMSDNSFVVAYHGTYHECFSKYIIDELYQQCDSMNEMSRIDTVFKIENIREIKSPKIKSTKL